MAIDPVCGMSVDENTAPAKATYQGKTYYFCSEECKTSFQQQPERYLKPVTRCSLPSARPLGPEARRRAGAPGRGLAVR